MPKYESQRESSVIILSTLTFVTDLNYYPKMRSIIYFYTTLLQCKNDYIITCTLYGRDGSIFCRVWADTFDKQIFEVVIFFLNIMKKNAEMYRNCF